MPFYTDRSRDKSIDSIQYATDRSRDKSIEGYNATERSRKKFMIQVPCTMYFRICTVCVVTQITLCLKVCFAKYVLFVDIHSIEYWESCTIEINN
jgi:hypothetical protein